MALSRVLPEMKVCRSCGAEKPETDFYLRRDGGRERRRNSCKACDIARLRSQRDRRTPSDWRDWHLRSKFGITQADYDAMLSVQDGCCALCGREAEDSYKGLHVDHDHETGRVRGLLCQRCNMALGLFDDSIPVLAEAIAYLSRARDAVIFTDDGVVAATAP